MYSVKIYDYYNCEVTQLTHHYKEIANARIYAIAQSARLAKKKCYAIIEDEEFNRFGWYENGIRLCD